MPAASRYRSRLSPTSTVVSAAEPAKPHVPRACNMDASLNQHAPKLRPTIGARGSIELCDIISLGRCCTISIASRNTRKSFAFTSALGCRAFCARPDCCGLFGVSELDSLSPTIEPDFFFREIGKVYPAMGERRGRVALLAGCIASVAFAELNRATIRVLTKNGIEVVVPQGQTCCGALHAHSGQLEKARELARKNIDSMMAPGIDAIVSNAAGCGAMLKEYGELLEHDESYAAKANAFASRTRDVNEYLFEVSASAPLPAPCPHELPTRTLSPRSWTEDPQRSARASQGHRSGRDRYASSRRLLWQRRPTTSCRMRYR